MISNCPGKTVLATAALIAILWSPAALEAGNWPQWRGPEGVSISRETGLPVSWSETSGIAWKCKLPEWGNSTPAIWADSVFVTAQDGEKLLLLRISKRTGDILWQRQVGSGATNQAKGEWKRTEERGSQQFHRTQNLASPSPVTDGERVVVHFGNGDLASYDFEGKEEWKRNLQADHGPYTIWWGHANSPVLHGDLVISVCMQDSLVDLGRGPSPSYVVAHDKRTGKEVWKTLRMTGAVSEPCDAYTTPVFRRGEAGTEMVVAGGTQVDAYDPLTGKQLWSLPGIGGNRTITGPTLGINMIFTVVGMRGPLLGIKPSGKGEIPKEAILWKHPEATPDSACPVVWGDLLFMVSDNGIASCLEARTGKLHWKERLSGNNRSSPLAADGRIYFLDMRGAATVLAAKPSFEKLAENSLDDEFIASPAVSRGRLFLRGKKSLYCIGKKWDPPAQPPSPPPGSAALFDGKSFKGWRVVKDADFEEHGDVYVEDGAAVLEVGNTMTGISWTGDFPREDYEVSLEAARLEGSDFFCGMTFPVGDSPCTLIVGGWGGTAVGLSNVDGQSAVENQTTRFMSFEKDRWYRIRLQVTREEIQAWIEGEQVIDLDRAGHKFTVWPQQEPLQPFGLDTWRTSGAMRNIFLRKL